MLDDQTIPELNWGIIGCGSHARRVMIPAFGEARGAELKAIACRSSESAAYLTRLQLAAVSCPDYDSVLTHPEVEAVYIGLPNSLHAEWTIKALATGKHVLCDKPIAMDLNQAQQIREAAQCSQRKVLEGFMYRFHPQHQEVKRLIASGAVGEIRLLEAHFHYYHENLDDIRFKAEYGGGGLLDVGCYLFDCSRFLLAKKPVSVSGNWCIGKESGVDECASFQVCYQDATAHLTCGTAFGRSNFYTLYGTKGSIHVRNAFHVPRRKRVIVEVDSSVKAKQTIHLPACNQFVAEIEGFSRWVHGLPVDQSLFGDGVENMRLLDAARRSAMDRRQVELG